MMMNNRRRCGIGLTLVMFVSLLILLYSNWKSVSFIILETKTASKSVSYHSQSDGRTGYNNGTTTANSWNNKSNNVSSSSGSTSISRSPDLGDDDDDEEQSHRHKTAVLNTVVDSSTPTEEERTTIFPDKHPLPVPEIPIIVELSGELGNHLMQLAHGYTIQLLLGGHNVTSKLVLIQKSNEERHQKTRRNLKECFPFATHQKFYFASRSNLNQELYGGGEKLVMRTQQQFWNTLIEQLPANLLLYHKQPWQFPTGTLYSTTKLVVDQFAKRLSVQKKDGDGSTNIVSTPTSSSAVITAPFIFTHNMINREYFDLFYDHYRTFFQMNETKCCSDISSPDEAVFVS